MTVRTSYVIIPHFTIILIWECIPAFKIIPQKWNVKPSRAAIPFSSPKMRVWRLNTITWVFFLLLLPSVSSSPWGEPGSWGQGLGGQAPMSLSAPPALTGTFHPWAGELQPLMKNQKFIIKCPNMNYMNCRVDTCPILPPTLQKPQSCVKKHGVDRLRQFFQSPW